MYYALSSLNSLYSLNKFFDKRHNTPIDHIACGAHLIYNIESTTPARHPTAYGPAVDSHSDNHVDHTHDHQGDGQRQQQLPQPHHKSCAEKQSSKQRSQQKDDIDHHNAIGVCSPTHASLRHYPRACTGRDRRGCDVWCRRWHPECGVSTPCLIEE